MKKSGGRARKAILQKMLDLLQSICYNTITSERFFFFAKEPVIMPCEYIVHVLFAHNIMLRTGTMIRAKPREAFTFTVSGFRRELVKAKNISVKREVPL